MDVTTERLFLRRFRESDRAAFRAMNRDPAVMEFLGPPLSDADSDATIARIEAGWEERGFGWWMVEKNGVFLGCCGLSVPRHALPFQPCVEVGWRLASAAWGRGFATEAARAAVRFGFARGLREIVSMTAVTNVRSRRVMEKLGMTRDAADDFDHPAVPDGDPLRRHVLFRLKNPGDSR